MCTHPMNTRSKGFPVDQLGGSDDPNGPFDVKDDDVDDTDHETQEETTVTTSTYTQTTTHQSENATTSIHSKTETNDSNFREKIIVIPITFPFPFMQDGDYDDEDEYEDDDEDNDDEDDDAEDDDAEDGDATRSRAVFTCTIPCDQRKHRRFRAEEADADAVADPSKARQTKYLKSLNQEERAFYVKLPIEEQAIMMDVETNVNLLNHVSTPLRFKVLGSQFDDKTKSIALNKLNLIKDMDHSNGESIKITNWINNMCKIPVNVYKSIPVSCNSSQTEICDFLTDTSNYFDRNIYGHTEAKEQIIRILAQWIANPDSKGNVIGIHGKPGVGKTTLVKDCICKALDIPFQFIPMGGASDGAYLDGHSYTYEGSTWGKIVDSLMKAGCMNPVLYFDEVDKISQTSRGQELINILIHLTDPSQNQTFYDKYFSDFPIDLSKCLIIFTYNYDDMIHPVLKDRLIRISTSDYKISDKLVISNNFILPELYTQFNIDAHDMVFQEDIIAYIIEKTTAEAGVRNLKRSFELLIGNINLAKMLKTKDYDGPIGKCFPIHPESGSIFPLTITRKIVDHYLKKAPVDESHVHLYT